MKIIKMLTKTQKFCCLAVVVVAIIGAGTASVWPVLLSNIYDKVSSGNATSLSNIINLILLFGTVFLVSELCAIIRRVSVDKIAASFEKHLRNISINKLLRLPTSFYSINKSGEYTAKINQSVSGSSQFVKVICNNVVPSIFISIFTITQVLRKAPFTIVLIMFTYIILELVVSIGQIISQNGIREKLIHKKAKLDGIVCQAIQNIEIIRVMNAEWYELERIKPKTEDIRHTESKHHSYMGTFDAIKQSLKVVYTVFLLIFSIYLVSKGELTRGMVITIVLLFQQLVVPIDAIHAFLDEIASSSVKAKELINLLNIEQDGIFSNTLKDTKFEDSDILIENVSVFTPDKKTIIAKDLSLEFKGKIITGLLGPTGSGKSSLLKAIMRYFPSVGKISIGSQMWDNFSQRSISDNIFYMTQDSLFFEGTLRENVAYGLNYNPTDEQIVFALRNACIYDELFKKDVDILNLYVSEKGSNFSGGQKQRIALARAFLRQPRWFFMDESTANLDLDTTARVLQNLENYAKSIDAGIVYISHQPEVIERCDEVINLNKTINKAA